MLPVEAIFALFPAGTEVCRLGRFRVLRLRPVSLAHAAAMEVMGCGLGQALDDAHALIAAWLLTLPPKRMWDVINDRTLCARRMGAWVKRHVRYVARINKAVNGAMLAALKTFVPGKKEGNQIYSDNEPEGFGWPLEIAEGLCGEYGWRFDEVLSIPLARALALTSIARKRNGGENGGPDYYERLKAKNINEFHKRTYG